jgi:hypothetical protein
VKELLERLDDKASVRNLADGDPLQKHPTSNGHL